MPALGGLGVPEWGGGGGWQHWEGWEMGGLEWDGWGYWHQEGSLPRPSPLPNPTLAYVRYNMKHESLTKSTGVIRNNQCCSLGRYQPTQ